MIDTIYLCIGLAIAFAFISAIFVHIKTVNVEKQMNKLLQNLDRAINGNLQVEVYDESMDASIINRLNQLIEINHIKTDALEKERDTIKVLISDISHQVRTPLTNILLYTGILNERNLNENDKVLTSKISQQAEKLDFYIRELIQTSYTEHEMIVINTRRNSVADMIQKSCQNVELSALKKEITILYEYVEMQAIFDEKWTSEAITNILDNSIKYSNEHSSVRIDTVLNESFVCINIQDQGIGIREEEQGKIFQRYFRGSNVKNQKGFGIGLYLAREIILKEGGFVKIKSKLNKGTTFQIYIPRF